MAQEASPLEPNAFTCALFSMSLVCLGSLGLWWYSASLGNALETTTWPTVPGYIAQPKATPSDSQGKRQAYKDFSYSYDFEGDTYTSTQITWSDTTTPGTYLAQQTTNNVTVYVNPVAPQEAVLIPGADVWTWFQIIVSLGVMAIGGGCLMLTIKLWQQERQPKRLPPQT